MADYDKDMAEERIQISDDKKKIHEDDQKKKDDKAKMMPDYGAKMTADPSSYRSSMSRHWHQSNLLKENPIVNHATEK
jgi:hypothetical protein